MIDAPPTIGPLDVDRLAAAYPWPEGRPWLKVVMVRTLDGAVAGPDGRSGSISSPTDRLVLAEVRRLGDAQVVGASTVRAEPYGPVVPRDDAAHERHVLGLAPAPRVVVVSGSLDLPWDAPLLAGSSSRPLVVTVEGHSRATRDAAQVRADLLELPGTRVDPVQLVGRLADLGLRRIVCEGGPGLVASLLAGGVVDEVDLSVSPLLTDAPAPAGQGAVGGARPFTLQHVLSDGEFLFTRYIARRDGGS